MRITVIIQRMSWQKIGENFQRKKNLQSMFVFGDENHCQSIHLIEKKSEEENLSLSMFIKIRIIVFRINHIQPHLTALPVFSYLFRLEIFTIIKEENIKGRGITKKTVSH